MENTWQNVDLKEVYIEKLNTQTACVQVHGRSKIHSVSQIKMTTDQFR